MDPPPCAGGSTTASCVSMLYIVVFVVVSGVFVVGVFVAAAVAFFRILLTSLVQPNGSSSHCYTLAPAGYQGPLRS